MRACPARAVLISSPSTGVKLRHESVAGLGGTSFWLEAVAGLTAPVALPVRRIIGWTQPLAGFLRGRSVTPLEGRRSNREDALRFVEHRFANSSYMLTDVVTARSALRDGDARQCTGWKIHFRGFAAAVIGRYQGHEVTRSACDLARGDFK